MTSYAHVTDGAIDHGPGPLPTAWKNISGLDKLTDEAKLKELGWLPVVDNSRQPGPGEVLDGYSYAISPDAVTIASVIRPMTPAELKAVHNNGIYGQIAALEATITERMWREDARGSAVVNPSTGKTSTQYIAWVDDEIATLRGQLLK